MSLHATECIKAMRDLTIRTLRKNRIVSFVVFSLFLFTFYWFFPVAIVTEIILTPSTPSSVIVQSKPLSAPAEQNAGNAGSKQSVAGMADSQGSPHFG